MGKLEITIKLEYTPEYVGLAKRIYALKNRAIDTSTEITELEKDINQYLDDLAEALPKMDLKEQQMILQDSLTPLLKLMKREPYASMNEYPLYNSPLYKKLDRLNITRFRTDDGQKYLLYREIPDDKVEIITEMVKKLLDRELHSE